jgi:formylglycine-generating enzyme required for sulfatase activity
LDGGLPDVDWVEIPGGPFLYGEKQEQRELPTFYLARYPVTNAQYQAFIDVGGYQNERWWRGLAERIETPDASTWPEPNRPRTDVSWYEAMAYCRWLSDALGYEVRLPSEEEWEKGARGTDGRAYPWGEDYQPGCANVIETWGEHGLRGLRQATAVGLYPQGASPYGLLDMAGNVWEWCVNEYENPQNSEPGGEAPRSMHGGSWLYGPGAARAFLRSRRYPDDRFRIRGFRLCCASSIRR